MNPSKKHILPAVWIGGLVIASACQVSLSGMALGSAAFALLLLLLQFPKSVFWLGYLLHGVWNRREAALRLYRYADSHGGKAGPPMIAYAMLLMEQSQYPQALTVLQAVQELDGLSPALRKISRQNLALAWEKTGDVSRAIEIMEKMRCDFETFSGDFYATLAYFYIEAGAYAQAEAYNELALSEDENCGAVYDNRALIAYKTGNPEQAAELFRKALALDGSMLSPQYYLGLIAEQAGDPETAARCFQALHAAPVTGLNTISRSQIEEKYRQYHTEETEEFS